MRLGIIILFIVVVCSLTYSFVRPSETISFNHEIRPILNAKCMKCHGGVRQQGGLSFLFEKDIYSELKSGKAAIVKGSPKKSEVYQRVISDEADLRMPPEGEALTEKEQQLIYDWIDQGAEWEEHWAYKSPISIDPPEVNSSWPINPIDQFVLHTLKDQNLAPSDEAEESILLRRVYLDLLGVPPTLKEQASYFDNSDKDRYANLVDKLLASEHYGEKWASMWLDLARYSDSQGYQKDHLRKTIWMYRDYVIHAFNEDLPFDQFTIEQLAGDLLDNATDEQHLATAFHRNTMTNDEGGTDDEEYRVKAVMDRVNTTMEIWQASTIACVQCHSHPYDPIEHDEYYGLMAYFNNTEDHDLTSDFPKMNLLSTAQKKYKVLLEEKTKKLTPDINPEELEKIVAEIESIKELPVPVMSELPKDSSRANVIFERGNWLMHGDTILPSVPATMHKGDYTPSMDRLGLAQWLVDTNNPTTSRVIVNRVWEQIFGQGIVTTLEDFGTQGDPPSHPELLDWLADRFQTKHGWSMKSLIKDIVLSATYRQSSDLTKENYEADPSNRWLSRGPRFRLSAEQIRDQALTVSGLLDRQVYGPSVMPHQPEGIWNVIRHVAKWKTSEGTQAYRRGLYTFMRRVSPYPTMITFDAPSRETCVSKRIRTNTPLQALTMLNDPVYVETAYALADTVMASHPESNIQQIKSAYLRASCCEIKDSKLKVLEEQFEYNVIAYETDTEALNKIIEDPKLRSPERAALYNVCTTIMNLDEVLMKK